MLLGCAQTFAQHDTFARVKVSPRQGVVKQAYKVTISVYTSTWYTAPLQFSNLQIDNAFIIPFTRTLSSMTYINNKGYATLTFYYLVFPYETGDIHIPPLEITATTPPEGDYKGVPVSIQTHPQTIKVNAIPSSNDESHTMVANDVYLEEKWNKPLNQLKVGDVIERTIDIYASGTLPSLISPFEPTQPNNTSLYPRKVELKDRRNDTEARGLRIEKYAYLFEKEGTITIPEEQISWYNPRTKRIYKRSLKAHTITIAPNPDLAMMQSLKDSLQALNPPLAVKAEKKELPWKKTLAFILASLFSIYVLRHLIRLIKRIIKQRQHYLQSEAFYFKQLLSAINKRENKAIINHLYQWYDRARRANHASTVSSFLPEEKQNLLESILSNPDGQIQATDKKVFKRMVKQIRNQLDNTTSSINSGELNPA